MSLICGEARDRYEPDSLEDKLQTAHHGAWLVGESSDLGKQTEGERVGSTLWSFVSDTRAKAMRLRYAGP
jgi:hypothetical protein